MLKKSANHYQQAGISCIPTDGYKRPIGLWKKYQTHIPTPEEIESAFSDSRASGIAMICGAVSGGIEVIDVDLKYDNTGTLFERLTEVIGELMNKLYIVETKSKGYHLIYRCEVIEGNQKLAFRKATSDELKKTPQQKTYCVIETRGEGGYVVAPPTEGYKRMNDFQIPIITIDEREHILSACRSFDEIVEIVKPKIEASKDVDYLLTPWEDYNQRGNVIDLLHKHGWTLVYQQGERIHLRRPGNTDSKTSGDYHQGKNLFKVFTTNSAFEPGKGYKPSSVYAILEHNGDFSASARQLAHDGYGQKMSKVNAKVLMVVNNARLDKISEADTLELVRQSNPTLSMDAIKTEIDTAKSHLGENVCTFWHTVITPRKKDIIFNRKKFIDHLQDNGFFLYYYDQKSTSYRILRNVEGIVYEVGYKEIKDYVEEYVSSIEHERFDGINKEELLNFIMKGSEIYFGRGLMEFMKKKDIRLLKDTMDEAFYPFTNGIVKITKDEIKLIPYSNNFDIWRSQQVPHEIIIDNPKKKEDNVFLRFLEYVSGIDKSKEKLNKENLRYLISLIGYLLHGYKDHARPFAVVFAEETEDEAKGGGTGKGILVKALSKLLNVEYVDGKNFKLDKSFAFQRVNLDTKIIAIEDIRKNVDFEGFYPIITEGITVEKKNKDEIFIPYEDSPKIIFTTNYTVPSNGTHAKRRQRVFEFCDYFHPGRTPEDVFGHILFDGWTGDRVHEWQRFYNFLFYCVHFYLNKRIPEIENSDKLKRKHIRLNYTAEFLDFMDNAIKNDLSEDLELAKYYEQFLEFSDMDKKDFTYRRFSKAIFDSFSKFGYLVERVRKGEKKKIHIKIIKFEG
jgi:hypothetical protein